MENQYNQFISDFTALYVINDRVAELILSDINVKDKQAILILQQLVVFHKESSKTLYEFLSDLPDIPVHNSYNLSSPLGLPEMEHSIEDLINKDATYQIATIQEAEEVLQKFYQNALENHEMPDVYKKEIRKQLDEFSGLVRKLDEIKSVSE